MTREQIEADIRILENIRITDWTEAAAISRATNVLRARLARMDGPPPGHVRARIAVDVGQWADEWVVWRQASYLHDPRHYDGMRRIYVTADLPLPEPAAEVEGEVE